MFDLNKIIDIIRENNKEVFLAKENNEDPVVLMSVGRYKELLKTSGRVEEIKKDNSFNNINEQDYSDYVKKTIMPGVDINE